MIVPYMGRSYRFVPWKPEHGRVLASPFAFTCATTRPDPERPWLVPAYALGAGCDGEQGVFVSRHHLPAFWAVHAEAEVVFHHAAFDLAVLDQAMPAIDVYARVDRDRVWDTNLLHRLLTLATAGHTAGGEGEATLEACVHEHLGVPLPDRGADAAGRSGFDQFLNRPLQQIPEQDLAYPAATAVTTLLLFRRLRERIDGVLADAGGAWGYVSDDWLAGCRRRWGPLTHHVQVKASVALASITRTGLHVDPAARDRLAAELAAARTEAAARLRGHGLLADRKGLHKGLQAKLKKLAAAGVSVPRTAGGEFATDADTLTDLADRLPFVPALLEHRTADLLLSAFVGKLGRAVVRPTFGVLTRTGRTTSSGQLNAQGVPRAGGVRGCFVPSPGHRFVAADFAAIELAALAQACRAQFGFGSAMAGRINAGEDLHRAFAAVVTGKPPECVTREEREHVKAINFGLPGGMGTDALRAYARANYGVEYTAAEVAELSARWLALFPEMRAFLADDIDVPLALAGRLALTPVAHHECTGDGRFARHPEGRGRGHRPSAILGAMGLKVLGSPAPRTRAGDPYPPADVDYLWERAAGLAGELPERFARDVAARRASPGLRRAVRELVGRTGVFTLTGRLRADAGYTQRRNTVFQGLTSDGAKLALWRVWRRGYRVVNFIHDELLVEVPADDPDGHARAVEAEMVAGMREVLPDVVVKVAARVGGRWGDG